MSENNEIKKVSLADAIRKKLEQKKQHTAGHSNAFQAGSAKPLKSQNSKKPNNQRRRTGGS